MRLPWTLQLSPLLGTGEMKAFPADSALPRLSFCAHTLETARTAAHKETCFLVWQEPKLSTSFPNALPKAAAESSAHVPLKRSFAGSGDPEQRRWALGSEASLRSRVLLSACAAVLFFDTWFDTFLCVFLLLLFFRKKN